MTTADFIRLVTRDMPNLNQSDYAVISDSLFKAIRQMQENTFCSKIRVEQSVNATAIASITVVAGPEPQAVTITTTLPHGFVGFVSLYIYNNALVPDGFYTFAVGGLSTLTANLFGCTAGVQTGGYYSLTPYGTFELEVYPEFQGTDYDATLYPHYLFNVIPIRVEAVWVVESDYSLSPVYLDGTREIQSYKDVYLGGDDKEYSGTVETEGQYVKLRTSFDLNGYTFQFWISYQIPYIADAFISTVTVGGNLIDIRNSLLETIPLRYQDRLISGVKYHLYKALEEKTNKGEYVSLMQYYEKEWKEKDLPRVMQECNRPMTRETMARITTKSVFTHD